MSSSTTTTLIQSGSNSLGITDAERRAIIAALGAEAKSWYKCPNGHIYCIGDCGRPQVTANCPDCGCAIGGAGHNLAANNIAATEMFG